ncbi:MAG: hypothetical protein H0T51_13175 [Pirellulales bacterium]|nr:hypothetical protein [Pirellulales bacterium]
MAISNSVIFGPAPSGKDKLTYGDVRKFTSDSDRIAALKARTDGWLIEQIQPLATSDPKGGWIVYSPFPLAMLTCIAIETLGQIAHGDSFNDDDRGASFKKVLSKIDSHFTRPPSKDQKNAFLSNWPNAMKPQSHSDILYSFFRNSLFHGYQGQAAHLTEDVKKWKMDDGALNLNPYWFWGAYKAAYDAVFARIVSKPASTEHARAVAFLLRLIS